MPLFAATNISKESFFMMQDSLVNATTHTLINYKNEEVEACVDWQRGDALEKGKYTIVFYIDGIFSGSKEFRLY